MNPSNVAWWIWLLGGLGAGIVSRIFKGISKNKDAQQLTRFTARMLGFCIEVIGGLLICIGILRIFHHVNFNNFASSSWWRWLLWALSALTVSCIFRAVADKKQDAEDGIVAYVFTYIFAFISDITTLVFTATGIINFIRLVSLS